MEGIRQWQDFEISRLRAECHKRNKCFYVISDNTSDHGLFYDFLEELKQGFSSYKLACKIFAQIMEQYPEKQEITIVDGDKILIVQDSFRFYCDGKNSVFEGNFILDISHFFLTGKDRKILWNIPG